MQARYRLVSSTARLTEVSFRRTVVLVQVHCKCTVSRSFQAGIQSREIKERACSNVPLLRTKPQPVAQSLYRFQSGITYKYN
jgi:hypothetical protein